MILHPCWYYKVSYLKTKKFVIESFFTNHKYILLHQESFITTDVINIKIFSGSFLTNFSSLVTATLPTFLGVKTYNETFFVTFKSTF